MKHTTIVYNQYGVEKEILIETLVEDVITDCDCGTGIGLVEELQNKVDSMEEVIARLLDVLVTKTHISLDDLAFILKSYRFPDKIIGIRKEDAE